MKILVIQLARLGDIYSNWPSLRAWKRNHPEAQLHFLVRKKFQAATEGLDAVDKVIPFDTEKILAASVQTDGLENQYHACLHELKNLIGQLQGEKYDQVINLSFSPFSSYFTKTLSLNATHVRGYSRFNDGFLNVNDDASAYFYAQVGIEKSNRFHVADLFAEVMGAELQEEDWAYPKAFAGKKLSSNWNVEKPYIAIHVGASQNQKRVPPDRWHFFIRKMFRDTKYNVILLGAPNEMEEAKKVALGLPSERFQNLVGQTKISDLFPLIENAVLFVGADSGPLHISSLTTTPVLNVSCRSVNFWETGPKARESYIVYAEQMEMISSDQLFDAATSILNGKGKQADLIYFENRQQALMHTIPVESDFCWKLVQAIYQGKDFPAPENKDFIHAMIRLREINAVALYQYSAGVKNSEQISILNHADAVIDTIAALCSDAQPIISWFRTEKIRVGPQAFDAIIEKYKNIHQLLESMLTLYLGEPTNQMEVPL